MRTPFMGYTHNTFKKPNLVKCRQADAQGKRLAKAWERHESQESLYAAGLGLIHVMTRENALIVAEKLGHAVSRLNADYAHELRALARIKATEVIYGR